MSINQTFQQAIIAHKDRKFQEAERLYRSILESQPKNLETYNNLGILLYSLGRFDEAETTYKKAIELKPDYAEAHNNLGVALKNLNRFKEAEIVYKKAIELKPDYAEAHSNLGNIHKELKQFKEAETAYKKAIELKPDYAECYINLGNLYKVLNRPEEALENFECATDLKPNINYLLGISLHAKMHLCVWDDLSQHLTEITKRINNGEKVLTPFMLLSLIDDPDLQRKSSEIYSNDKYPKSHILPKISYYQGHKKIKIGYFSPDFKNHPVSHLTVELYEMHDRENFEIHAFSLSSYTEDERSTRIKAGVDYFHDVSMMSDLEVAGFARTLEIDIAVDLAGFTEGCRPNIFAISVAPLQVGYIGYLGTMGVDYYDYIIADRTIIPDKAKKYYSEKIVYLPCYQVNESINYSQDNSLNRKDFNIPEDVFVFCCFNNTYKITPDIFNCWTRILKEVDQSVLMLFAENETTIKNLRIQISNRGINPNRLIIAKRLARFEYFARYQVVDLLLDTLPFNGGTTTSDALRTGAPVLTCIGKSFASRMAASLLNALDLPELISTTLEQYESFAIELSTNPAKFNTLKKKLASRLLTAQLYDSSLFTKHLETAYKIMNERYKNGSNVEDIEVNN